MWNRRWDQWILEERREEESSGRWSIGTRWIKEIEKNRTERNKSKNPLKHM